MSDNSGLVNSGLDFEAPCSVQGNTGGRETMALAAEGPPTASDALWPVRPWASGWHNASEDGQWCHKGHRACLVRYLINGIKMRHHL